jgi:hypothetical protein
MYRRVAPVVFWLTLESFKSGARGDLLREDRGLVAPHSTDLAVTRSTTGPVDNADFAQQALAPWRPRRTVASYGPTQREAN